MKHVLEMDGQGMKVKTTCVCRGEKRAYYGLRLKDVCCDSGIELCVTDGFGREIPSSLYIEKNGDDNSIIFATIVFMLADCQSYSLELAVKDYLDVRHLIWKKALNATSLKWVSRLNYKVRPFLCQAMKDNETNSFESWIRWQENLYISTASQNILKATLNICGASSDIAVKLADRRGVIDSLPYVGLCVGQKGNPLFHQRDLTVRFPDENEDYCLYIVDKVGLQPSRLVFLDCGYRKELKMLYARHFTNAQNDPEYGQWYARHCATDSILRQQAALHFEYEPRVSIVVLLDGCEPEFLVTYLSLVSQSYENWELILVNASSDNEELHAQLKEAVLGDGRVAIIEIDSSVTAAAGKRAGIQKATGAFVGFLESGDTLAPETLFEYIAAINSSSMIDLLYCDEDQIDEQGMCCAPCFKPDFNVDMLRCYNYIQSFLMMRRGLFDHINSWQGWLDGAWEYDLVLRSSEEAREVYHIRKVLYHRRACMPVAVLPTDSLHANEAGKKALENHLKRCKLRATVRFTQMPFTYRTIYELDERPLISIIIPNKDYSDALNTCVDSIQEKSSYANYEIIIIENNSVEKKTFDAYERLTRRYANVHIIYWKREFSFAEIINFGVKNASGDYLLFLNNDTELISPDFLETLLGFCMREDVGAVGAKLYYPDDTVQHAGVGVGLCGSAAELFKHLDRHDVGYCQRAACTQDLSAVTAACMMTKRRDFYSVGGLSPEFAVAYNDTDYCLKLRNRGLNIVYAADAELYHHESLSRGIDNNSKPDDERARYQCELCLFQERWECYITGGDPYLSPSLDIRFSHFCLKDKAQ